MHVLHLLPVVFLTGAWSSPSRNTCGHSARRMGSTMRIQFAANPDHTRLGAHADHLGRLPRACIWCAHTVELVHISRLGATYIQEHWQFSSGQIENNSAWLRFFFPQKNQKVTLVQMLALFWKIRAGFVLKNKPTMILDLGEYLKAQSGRILQIN